MSGATLSPAQRDLIEDMRAHYTTVVAPIRQEEIRP